MCGIAGIIYRNPELYSHLGTDLLALIQPLESRGPDSSGVALYGHAAPPQHIKLLLRGQGDWPQVTQYLEQCATVSSTNTVNDVHQLVLNLTERQLNVQALKRDIHSRFPGVHFSSAGQTLEIYKEVGAVENLDHNYGLRSFAGSHGIGHTRMATESIVDIDHCHPFTSNFDLSIVHNGQISNYHRLRFHLERAGMVFETQNDSEAIAHYIYYQLLQGNPLETALEKLTQDIDGTYTFLVSTPDKVALVRDKFAAKPAVIYETDDMVAIASEYRALLNLSTFDPSANIREPDAGEINVWAVSSPTRELQPALR
jgi:amidophosphoribosyltransferase